MTNQVKKAVILCGGLATRFLPISKSVPKEMLPILDKPVLQIIVEQLSQAGVTDILIVLGRGKECICNHFDRNVELEQRLIESGKLDLLETCQKTSNLANIYYVRQPKPMGTGYSVKLAKTFVGDDPFVLAFGDEIMISQGENIFQTMISGYEKCQKTLISIKEVDKKDVSKYGIVDCENYENSLLKLKRIVEKPNIEDAPSNYAYIGGAVLTSNIFPEIEKLKPGKGGEYVLTDAFDFLAKRGEIYAQKIEGERYDIGDKFGFVKANIEICLKDEKFGNQLKEYLKNLVKTL